MQLVQRCKFEHTIKSLIVSRNSLRSSTAVPWYNSARKKGTWCKCVCTFSLQFFTHHSQHAPLQCVCTFSLQFFTHQFTARTPPMCVHFFTAVFHLPVHSAHPSQFSHSTADLQVYQDKNDILIIATQVVMMHIRRMLSYM